MAALLHRKPASASCQGVLLMSSTRNKQKMVAFGLIYIQNMSQI